MMIISEKSKFSSRFMAAEVVICIISSFVYAWFSAFAVPEIKSTIFIIEALIESFFALSMLKVFFTDFTPEGQHMPNRNLADISKNYLQHDFFKDLIPLIPITLTFLDFHMYVRLFYFLKVTRIFKAARIPISQLVLDNVKELRKKRIIK